MLTGSFKIALALIGFFLFFSSVISVSPVIDDSQNKNCSCKGPTNHYKEIGCTPVFKDPNDCCPIRYNCSVPNNLRDDECLINGHVYANGEHLSDDHSSPCNGACICKEGRIVCSSPDCPERPPCLWLGMENNCCGGRPVCFGAPELPFTCEVDGNTYLENDVFMPAAEPNKRCRCNRGYTGENVEPYCKTVNHTSCTNALLLGSPQIREYVPVYNLGVSMETGCSDSIRFPVYGDDVNNQANQTLSEGEDLDMLCKFGDIIKRVGEELIVGPHQSKCVKCICEVPPMLSCTKIC